VDEADPRLAEFIERLAEALAAEYLRKQSEPPPEEKDK
jgi:hypothetical protein